MFDGEITVFDVRVDKVVANVDMFCLAVSGIVFR
jgi:hypothetical protein